MECQRKESIKDHLRQVKLPEVIDVCQKNLYTVSEWYFSPAFTKG